MSLVLWEELQTHPLVFLSAKMEVLAVVGPGMPLMNLQEEEAFPVAVEGDMPEKVKLMAKTDLLAAEVPSTAEATRSTKQVRIQATAKS